MASVELGAGEEAGSGVDLGCSAWPSGCRSMERAVAVARAGSGIPKRGLGFVRGEGVGVRSRIEACCPLGNTGEKRYVGDLGLSMRPLPTIRSKSCTARREGTGGRSEGVSKGS